jgi:hypothetical protein
MAEPLSPTARAVLDAAFDPWQSTDTPASIAAAALRAAADHIDHDWSGFNCVDALYEIAAELETQ